MAAASLGVLVALCLLSVAVAAPAAGSNSMCNVPKVFEATIAVTSSVVASTPDKSQVLLVDGSFHSDLTTENKIAVLETVYSESATVEIRIVEDFTAKIEYVIVPSQKVCTKKPLSQQDIWVASKVSGTQKLGLANPLTVSVYSFNNTQGTQVNYYTRYYVSAKECLPVFREFVGLVQGNKEAQGALFSDLSLSIKDPSVFSIPTYCHQQDTNSLLSSQLILEALSRHRSRRALWA